jgi:hypothetical protein
MCNSNVFHCPNMEERSCRYKIIKTTVKNLKINIAHLCRSSARRIVQNIEQGYNRKNKSNFSSSTYKHIIKHRCTAFAEDSTKITPPRGG